MTTSGRGFPVEGVPVAIAGHDLRVEPGPHPYAEAMKEPIARHWAGLVAANPTLYDGPVVFQHEAELVDGMLRARAFMTGFSTLLYWRDHGRGEGALHLFPMALPVTSEGDLLAVRMAPHTANPGQIYCAAGSLDLNDIRNGIIDPVANMHREVREETGLDLDHARAEPGLHAMRLGNVVVMLRRYHLDRPGSDLLAAIDRHIAGETNPEITGGVLIGSGDRAMPGLAHFMPGILAWHFDRS